MFSLGRMTGLHWLAALARITEPSVMRINTIDDDININWSPASTSGRGWWSNSESIESKRPFKCAVIYANGSAASKYALYYVGVSLCDICRNG